MFLNLDIDYEFISFGGGRDSTALLFEWWRKDLAPIDIIFVNPGAEFHQTLDHVSNMMKLAQDYGHKVIIIHSNIYDDFYKRESVPNPAIRTDCTHKHKIRPIKDYIRLLLGVKTLHNKNIIQHIGFNKDERKRATINKTNIYPLIEWGIGKKEINLILKENLDYEVISSRCFICPFQTYKEWHFAMKHYGEKIKKLVLNADRFLCYPLRIREGQKDITEFFEEGI